ncbi:hypothetical protein BCU68_13810 [Vibrio sp. 10N.286.49.B3]|uniref:RDD family protein n=1 Tax=Vibrio sp. 10N.286.49.B3 TaxID=1880855 RepID=UPI000C8637C0|nr:RDD family protein [Vibrio sp. 10N.286.49.B3]PMH42511.1 hypothetical protein BCU68_13810 [Vibrio sp. 10N.286.49.B3]
MTHSSTLPAAGLFRRSAALLYDALIIIAIEMIAAGIVIAILEALVAIGILNYGIYRDVSDLLTQHPLWSPLFTFYLAAVWIYFFVYFWTKAGQTLGMRAWKLQIQTKEGLSITPTQALIRLGTSGFGLANLTVPFDPEKRGFHDIWAKTQVVVLSKAK